MSAIALSRSDYKKAWKLRLPGEADRAAAHQAEAELRKQKRAHLTEIVQRLGEDATPVQIREEAYRDGFGRVSGAMLILVRNNLWPDRKKERSGRPVGAPTTRIVADASSATKCPSCSGATIVRTVYRLIGGVTKRGRECKVCQHKFTTVGEAALTIHPRRALAKVAKEKECSKCKNVLPVERFSKKSGDADLYVAACRRCVADARREAYGKRSIVQLYGITPDQYREMFAKQDGKCAICRQSETGKRAERGFPLAIDHCHSAGSVRGLLCNKCNLGLGNFNDEITRLEAALVYLRQHKEERSSTYGWCK